MITGSRAEYSYYQPIIREITKRSDLDYGIIATCMHPLETFGSTIEEVRKDGFKIHAVVRNNFDGYNHITMAKSLAVLMMQLPELFEQMGADMVLVAGDRGEQFAGAVVGVHMYLPVAHIQAGELSGNIDGTVRHAITRFAHIHFTSNQDAFDRIIKFGEQPERVHLVGAPQVDDLVHGKHTSPETLYKKFDLKKSEPFLLFVFHPVTEEMNRIEQYTKQVMEALQQVGVRAIIIANNSDAGSNLIRKTVQQHIKPFMSIFDNLPREDYAGLMALAGALVGNSSGGILEAPTFELPAVNIGNREKGRLQGKNVINTGYGTAEVVAGIKKALSPEFKKGLKGCVNPYGDGKAAPRIVDVLASVKIDDALLIKQITY